LLVVATVIYYRRAKSGVPKHSRMGLFLRYQLLRFDAGKRRKTGFEPALSTLPRGQLANAVLSLIG
jgi:hypothetical protein